MEGLPAAANQIRGPTKAWLAGKTLGEEADLGAVVDVSTGDDGWRSGDLDGVERPTTGGATEGEHRPR